MPDEQPKVVIDTNLFVRGLLKGPGTLPLIEAWLDKRFVLVTSEELIAELAEVVARPKLRARISPEDGAKLLELIYRGATVVRRPEIQLPLCRDPDDYPVLAAAIAGEARFIVSGDKDLYDDSQLRTEMAALGVKIVGTPDLSAWLRQMTAKDNG